MAKILIVDDDRDIKELMEFYLQKKGYTVDSAEDGNQALELIAKDKPDLIIMDMFMPEKDGVRTIEELQQNPTTQEIPIIMISGARDEMDMMKGLMERPISYIEKPFSNEKLISLITSLLKENEEGDVSV